MKVQLLVILCFFCVAFAQDVEENGQHTVKFISESGDLEMQMKVRIELLEPSFEESVFTARVAACLKADFISLSIDSVSVSKKFLQEKKDSEMSRDLTMDDEDDEVEIDTPLLSVLFNVKMKYTDFDTGFFLMRLTEEFQIEENMAQVEDLEIHRATSVGHKREASYASSINVLVTIPMAATTIELQDFKETIAASVGVPKDGVVVNYVYLPGTKGLFGEDEEEQEVEVDEKEQEIQRLNNLVEDLQNELETQTHEFEESERALLQASFERPQQQGTPQEQEKAKADQERQQQAQLQQQQQQQQQLRQQRQQQRQQQRLQQQQQQAQPKVAPDATEAVKTPQNNWMSQQWGK